MIAGVGVEVVQVEQEPAAGALSQLIQKLGLAHVLLRKVDKVDAVFEDERNRNFLSHQAHSVSHELEHLVVIRDRNGETGIEIAVRAADLRKGKVVAMPGKFVAFLKAGDLVQV